MAASQTSEVTRSPSPDPASHAATIYDASGNEGEWLDETDDDDMDFEPATDEDEDAEFFDPAEDTEVDFHGMCLSTLSATRRIFDRILSLTLFFSLE